VCHNQHQSINQQFKTRLIAKAATTAFTVTDPVVMPGSSFSTVVMNSDYQVPTYSIQNPDYALAMHTANSGLFDLRETETPCDSNNNNSKSIQNNCGGKGNDVGAIIFDDDQKQRYSSVCNTSSNVGTCSTKQQNAIMAQDHFEQDSEKPALAVSISKQMDEKKTDSDENEVKQVIYSDEMTFSDVNNKNPIFL
jgi:hypothetical protein